ncbi:MULTISPECIES: sensor histidine kinase [unclassified Streptomyces]|uniref:sensor histidine kinase n=1 Tax=unclassified Streptomyces TaxID=2593676 RepID=UPI001660AAEE|nr:MULTISPECIES: ATP-binding protein [unclassified Streptomyces]MBD0709734.1 histidine kinase [Streptomyces sp. CBMA291]MBD0715301.1 histidine kinase [Streptomyces sp. CBMA370]
MFRFPTVPALRRCVDRWTLTPRTLDTIAAFSAFGLMGLDVPGLARADNSLTGVTASLVLAAGAATLMLRRRLPWISFGVALGLMAWLHELTMIQFTLYALGRYRGRRAAVAATLLYVAVAYALFQTPGWSLRHGDSLSGFLSLVVPIGVLASGVGVAAYRQDLVRALEVQRREAAARQAVQEERISVGRDVHDLVGRELTVLAVRAEVLAVRARGEAHQQDFEELADTARRAHLMLNETIVRRADRDAATPGLDGLTGLAEESERMGSPVDLVIAPGAKALSPLRQAAVHRVVQECLTNAAKHAPGLPVAVTITVDGRHLRTEVRNPLPKTPPDRAPVSTGTGLFSMEERVTSMGGTLHARREGDTYAVTALLPTGLPH